ncbi:unnamed protein product [Caenorhabditis angaria]|uniref:Uncharacterized protein n=1 Tax=Caenorhabditis angaria TaxID=860376 RepID=A0A9P1IKJ4_9PELO|nr:unnamed protein product [Caenorhabditis angaria]
MGHIVLAIFFFSSIVNWLEGYHWDYIHRYQSLNDFSPFCSSRQFSHVTMPKTSILVAQAEIFEKSMAKSPQLMEGINYYHNSKDELVDEDEIWRENRKIRQNAYYDEKLIRQQNFKAWAGDRTVERGKDKKNKSTFKLRRRR